jgi:hypothetical protein
LDTQPNATQAHYFAAVNSSDGFQNYFDTVFSSLDRLYIIKGGSGTGKSHLMRVIAKEATARGYTVEYYDCSSDPASLDGILILDLRIGILDGTAPHTTDPIYPGVRDEIVNVGDFWDTDALCKKKAQISALIDEKKLLYAQAYRYLHSARVMEETIRAWIAPHVKREKMERAVIRLTSALKGDRYSETLRLCEAISMDGAIAYDTIERGRELWFVRDRFGISDLFFDALRTQAREKGLQCEVSLRPLIPTQIRAMAFPSEKICVSAIEDERLPARAQKRKIINLDRFLDLDALSQIRQKIRFCRKCRDASLQAAYATLSEIKNLHFSLENCYIPCMDFEKKEAYTAALIKRIFT